MPCPKDQFEEANDADENSNDVEEFDFNSDDGGLEFPQAKYDENGKSIDFLLVA